MALPAGITPKTVTVGIASFFDGTLADGTATITAPVNVVHTPTNRPIFSSVMSQKFVDGVAQFTLAPTDAPGLNRVDWTYKLNVAINGALVQPDPIYFILPAAGPDTIDLDGLVTVPSSAGVPISATVVTSVNGQTGDVTVAGGTGGAVVDATASVKGVVKLAGDLGGTATSPTVPGLAGKANTSHTHGVTDLTATGTKDSTTFLRGDNTWAVPAGSGGGGGGGSTLVVATTVTASGALVVGKHNPVDATSAAKAMTLPTGAASGSLLSVEKTDASTNAVNVTGNVRGAAGTTISLVWQNEDLLFAADTSGSWWPIAGHKTKTSLDAAYKARAVYDPASYGAVYNGTTNDHAAVQAAIDACSAAGGGVVKVTGNIANSTTLIVKSGVLLDLGSYTVGGAASPQIAIATTGSPEHIGIRGGFISGPGDGINLDTTGGAYQLGWPRITVENVTLVDCGGRGIHTNGDVIEARLINVVSLRSTGIGIHVGTTDTILMGCTAAQGGANGIVIQGGNSKLTACKSYGNTGSGFWIIGAGRHMLSSCEAQDNTVAGFLADGDFNTLSACLADSNGSSGFALNGNNINAEACTAMYGGGGSGQVTPVGFALTGSRATVSGASNCATTVTDTGTGNRVNVQSQGGTARIDSFTAAERTKLTGIATGATANSADATLLARANHTGTQAASTITGLATVATTGAYADLSGKPAAGAAAPYPSSLAAGVTLAKTYDPVRNLYNVDSQTLTNWHAAVARARTGGASARLACIGDSTTKSNNGTNAQINAYPTRMKTLLAQVTGGVTVVDGGFFLNDNVNDTRWSALPTGWNFNAAAGFTQSLTGATTATGPVVLTVTGQDTLRVYWAKNTGLGTIVVTVNDGTDRPQTINTNGAQGIGFTEWTGLTAGTQTVSFAAPTVSSVFLIGLETFSANGKLLVLNEGMGGALTSHLLVGGATGFQDEATLLTFGAAKPDLMVIDLMINDWSTNVTPSSAQTNLQSFITAAKAATQDVLLVVPVPPNESGAGKTFTWAQYAAVMYALADANNLPLIDMTARWKDHATATAKGLKVDSLHPSATGYADKAQGVLNAVAAA